MRFAVEPVSSAAIVWIWNRLAFIPTRIVTTIALTAVGVWQDMRTIDIVFRLVSKNVRPTGRTNLHYTSKHRLCDTTQAACQGKPPETPHRKGVTLI